jgi:hypothetical protein
MIGVRRAHSHDHTEQRRGRARSRRYLQPGWGVFAVAAAQTHLRGGRPVRLKPTVRGAPRGQSGCQAAFSLAVAEPDELSGWPMAVLTGWPSTRRLPGGWPQGFRALFGLSLDAVTDGTRCRVDSRRSGAEHDAARNDCMAVRAGHCRELVADYGLSSHVLALS